MGARSGPTAPLLLLLLIVAGCGARDPYVDPRPINDGGIVERTVTEGGGPTDRIVSDAGGDSGGAGGTDGGVLPGDDGGQDADPTGDVRPPLAPTTLQLSVTDPLADELRVARGRFTPRVTAVVTSDLSVVDDVGTVSIALWSTGSTPAQLSETALALLSKVTAADGGAPAAGPATATFTYGDTPVDLSVLSTGSYELRVTAATLAGVGATARRSFRVDAGPIIRVLSPTANQAVRNAVVVRFEVIDPFSSDPPTVTASIAGIPLTGLGVTGTLYQVTVPETIAAPPLSGGQLLDIGAVNAAGVAASNVVVPFVFDDAGPTITNTRPGTGALIGGIIRLEAEVTDPAGVDGNTVVAVVAHGGDSFEVHLDRDPTDAKHFTHLFDTRRLSTAVLYPTLSFRASDLPGNQSAVGYLVAIDNTPPLADLDPPADLRVRRFVSGQWRCSWELDPVGRDAIDDGDGVRQLFDVRARVEDQGNSPAAGGADITPLAGLDPARVELLVLDDSSRALVVDSDGDGVCDAVNPLLVPTTNPMSSMDALLVNLAPVPPVGAADFTPDPSVPSGTFLDCETGTDPLPPPLLCLTSDMTVAVPAHAIADLPAIWTIPNVVPATPLCVGNQLDALGNHLTDGPACLAVRAYDRLGNSQVSRVLHVCIDHDARGGECPFQPLAGVDGGSPVRVQTQAPHGLATGDRVLVGAVPQLFDANGMWVVTVDGPSSFILDGAATPAVSVAGGQFMRWPTASSCTGRRTSLDPVVVDDRTPCRPWRSYRRGEHLYVP